ncbi:LLM class flavin-dependent oxidoreductase [Herbiconiux sp. CPCC 203407]|uniref:LLM class flavin-dependent oxidoreductase n=1 Tax=Herbiconiux oxytropis TaxID=2970915 RepID=A0AA41XEV5_9MICO|nr:LLM class flavin-dependent oxidoreductase [Herbiconiux oxytropis]MCS5724141.1 LLM class flavin-dependent oxidoreductase [Herbiconiux oxytropis]MCS5726924.1 LLM class flavin-dependent oxidoreductase [Herbiconiux oxytropis]
MTPLNPLSPNLGDFDPATIKFGIFQAPYHPLNGNPTLQIRRDIQLAQVADELGFDEYWMGEHHSSGIENIPSPELFIAAAAERTSRITFGTGVVSLPYHHPLLVADRIAQLDHQTNGRVILGVGPGKLPVDAIMMGIDPVDQRRMQGESLEAVTRLLRGEVVNMETDWFTLKDGRAQLQPVRPEGIEIAVASTVSPSGSVLAAKHGASLFSLAAGDKAGFDALDRNWDVYEKESLANGYDATRRNWRVVTPMFLAESREDADRAIRRKVLHHTDYLEQVSGVTFPWARDAQSATDQLRGEGWPSFGSAVIGTPDEAIEAIEALIEKTGGFGSFLVIHYDMADWDATKKSYELFAEEVIPHFRRSNRGRVASLQYHNAHAAELGAGAAAAITKATKEYYGEGAAVPLR